MSLKRVIAVRPYDDRIRHRVVALLEAAGCALHDEDIIAPGTPDEEAVRFVLAREHSILLVPFHGHRGADGSSLDGLGFVERLREAAPRRGFRVLMPVSRFGRAAVMLARVPEEVLLLDVDSLDEPATTAHVRAHLSARAPTRPRRRP